jgi:hypothetical protein
MEIKIKRTHAKGYTHGLLTIEGESFKCFTLEDEVRLGDIFKVKVQDKTAIPVGRYEVILNMSNRFKRYMPLLLNVPNFSGIRIHSGNTKEHTEGCVLVGYENGNDGFLGNSRTAFNDLMKVLRKVEKKEKIFITIE